MNVESAIIPEKKYDESTAQDLLEWTAAQAIFYIRTGAVTAERYASQLLQRYRETRILNAITWIDEDRVLEAARAVDSARFKGPPLGRLAGLPIVVKDNISTVGFPTTAGTAALRDFYPQRNARIIDILDENGAILLGKANMDELGRGFTNSNATYGFAKNPYDTSRVPGGGAGGTAAAISARITPAGLGSDTAGSARIPSSFCGIAGMRPSTSGRLKGWGLGSWDTLTLEDGIVPITFAVTTPGPMGRTVADVALLHSVVTGSPESPPVPMRGARIGVPRGFYWENLEPEVLRVSDAALERLRDAGAILINVDLTAWAQRAVPIFTTLGIMHGLKDLGDYLARNGAKASLDQVVASVRSKDIEARLKRILDNPVPPEKAEAAVRTRVKLALEYEELLRRESLAAIVVPTVPIVAPPIRPQGDEFTDTVEINGKKFSQFDTVNRNTHVASVVGIPSVSIPCGLSSSGLPVGLNFCGMSDGDSRLLGLSRSIEAVLGRLPAPVLRANPPAQATTPPAISTANNTVSAGQPATPAAASSPPESAAHVQAVLKKGAYMSLCGSFDVHQESGAYIASASLRRYDVDFRVDGCGSGIRAVNLVGDECGRASVKWTFQPKANSSQPGGAVQFTMDNTFVFDDEGRNQLRGVGSGRMLPKPSGDGRFGVDAYGTLTEGTGIFAGVLGSYALAGTYERSRLNVHFTIHLLDPGGIYQTESELLPLNGTQPGDRLLTCLTLLGEADPDQPVQTTSGGASVHVLLRAVHTDFDLGRNNDSLRSTMTVGPVVARWRSEVSFTPSGESTLVRLQNIVITFSDRAGGVLEAAITDGQAYPVTLPGVSGRLLRITGFGPIQRGTGRFQAMQGTVSLVSAINLSPPALSNLYLLHLFDPNGNFRC